VAAFLGSLAVEYALFHRLLRAALRTRDISQWRPALNRWLAATVAWQVVVVAACVLYLVAIASKHGPGAAWVAPPVGAVFGGAIPLQFVAVAIVRATRP